VKGRPDGKPLPLIAGTLEQVEEIGELSPLSRRLADAFWPGPLTLVVPVRSGLALHPALRGPDGSVGVRWTSGAVAAALSREAGGVLVATSANLSGAPAAAAAADLDPALRQRLDYVLDAGPSPGGRPSTVVTVVNESLELVREGVVPFEAVLEAARRG
jgi:L-threonylcarbamoyladenylate synthase